MTYRSPGITIQQILLRASQPLEDSELLPCYVGPINQVVSYEPIAVTLPITAALNSAVYPKLALGAIPWTKSIQFFVKNAAIRIKEPVSAIGVFTAGSNSVTIADAPNVNVGDVVKLDNNGGSYIIAKVLLNNTFELASAVNFAPTTGDTTKYSIERFVGDIEATPTALTATESGWSISGLTFSVASANYAISSGAVGISYLALRKDLTGFYEVTNLDTLAADMSLDILNPLGFILGQCVPLAGGGRRSLAYILSDGTDAAYAAAMEKLATRTDPYLVSSVSTSPIVQQTLAAHAENMSTKENGLFRAALVTTGLVETVDLITGASFVKA